MKKLTSSIVVLAILVSAASLPAQQAKKVASTGGTSPHETTSTVIGGCRVTITYGRPFTKDPKTGDPRTIWGGLVPWDKSWRTGADEATLLITEQPLAIGDTTIPAGAHTLYTVPSESGDSKLVFSKHLGKWGVPVDEKNDLARVDMKKETLENPVNQFTMAVAKNPAGGGVIKLMWEGTQFSVPFTVKK